MKPAVLDLTREEWTAAGLAIIDGQPAGIRFTADDIRPHLPQPHHPNAFGALFMTAKHEGSSSKPATPQAAPRADDTQR